jgi:hypothetical protein
VSTPDCGENGYPVRIRTSSETFQPLASAATAPVDFWAKGSR